MKPTAVKTKRKRNGQFLPGTHWREHAPFRDKDYLLNEYVILQRSAGEIATCHGVTDSAIYHWLAKHGIPRRDNSEVRKVKHWGVSGPDNPMFGKVGPANPNYVDGSSPERQRMYAQSVGKGFIRAILARDNYCCRRCSATKEMDGSKSLHVHHIKPWAGHPELRFDPLNVVTLCRTCHSWVHSKLNILREFLDIRSSQGPARIPQSETTIGMPLDAR
jgi:hypothetical protein